MNKQELLDKVIQCANEITKEDIQKAIDYYKDDDYRIKIVCEERTEK